MVPITERTIPTLTDPPLTYLEQYAPAWVCELLELCDELA
jgi:hypothetical protein